MFVAIWRIVSVRVRPDVVLSFKRYGTDDGADIFSLEDGRSSSFSTVRSTWKSDNGVFSWADKGRWETIQQRPDSEEADWFRIGFEPVFSAYTKQGVYFVVISLFEVGQLTNFSVVLPSIIVFGCFFATFSRRREL